MQNVVNRQFLASAETLAVRRQFAHHCNARRHHGLRRTEPRLQDEAFNHYNRLYSTALAKATELTDVKREDESGVDPAHVKEHTHDVRHTTQSPLGQRVHDRSTHSSSSSRTQTIRTSPTTCSSPGAINVHKSGPAEWKSIHDRLVWTRREDRPRALKQTLRAQTTTRDYQQAHTFNKIVQAVLQSKLMPEHVINDIVFEFVTELLLQNPPRLAVVYLLETGAIDVVSKDLKLRAYMDWLLHKGFALNVFVKTAARFLQTLNELDIKLDGSLAQSIFRGLAKSEDMASILRVFPGLIEKCELANNIKMTTPVIVGYAKRQDWSSVDKILSHITSNQEARKQPYLFADLLSALIRIYARHATADQIYDFTMYYIQNFSWVATPELGATVAVHLIKAGRHDLTYAWIQQIQKTAHIWYVDSFRDLSIALLAPLWRFNKAPCREVLACCRMLGRGQIHDPFSQKSRNIISDAIVRDVAGRLKHLPSVQDVDWLEQPPYDVIRVLRQARMVVDGLSKVDDDGRKSRRLQVQELGHQLSAVEDLIRLLRGASVADDLRHAGKPETGSTFRYEVEVDCPPDGTEEELIKGYSHRRAKPRQRIPVEHRDHDDEWNELTAWSMNPREAAVGEFPF